MLEMFRRRCSVIEKTGWFIVGVGVANVGLVEKTDHLFKTEWGAFAVGAAVIVISWFLQPGENK